MAAKKARKDGFHCVVCGKDSYRIDYHKQQSPQCFNAEVSDCAIAHRAVVSLVSHRPDFPRGMMQTLYQYLCRSYAGEPVLGAQRLLNSLFGITHQAGSKHLAAPAPTFTLLRGPYESKGVRREGDIADFCRAELPASAGVPGFKQHIVHGQAARYYVSKEKLCGDIYSHFRATLSADFPSKRTINRHLPDFLRKEHARQGLCSICRSYHDDVLEVQHVFEQVQAKGKKCSDVCHTTGERWWENSDCISLQCIACQGCPLYKCMVVVNWHSHEYTRHARWPAWVAVQHTSPARVFFDYFFHNVDVWAAHWEQRSNSYVFRDWLLAHQAGRAVLFCDPIEAPQVTGGTQVQAQSFAQMKMGLLSFAYDISADGKTAKYADYWYHWPRYGPHSIVDCIRRVLILIAIPAGNEIWIFMDGDRKHTKQSLC